MNNMNKCEYCIKSDVCKFKDKSEPCGLFIHKAILNDPIIDKITKEQFDEIRGFIVDHIMRNPYIMLSEEYREAPDEDGTIDLPEVIASLYEVLHRQITGKSYEYMFHWANKVGSDVEDNLFLKERS